VPNPTKQNGDMLTYLKELFAARELFYTWARREFRVRYSQSFLGAAWAILQPLALMVVYSLIFSVFIRVPTDGMPYPIFAYAALLPWTFFANSLTFAIPSLVNNMNLVSKIYFPREILPLAAIVVCFIDFLIAGSLFVVMMFIYRIPVGPSLLLMPLILLVQVILTFGVSLVASAVNVFYRDVRFVVPLALQVWMYLSPVIHPVSQIPERYRSLYLLNPMAALVDSYRRITLFREWPDWPHLGLAALVSVLVAVLAYGYFKRAESQFADLI